jgi:hypothetical protein
MSTPSPFNLLTKLEIRTVPDSGILIMRSATIFQTIPKTIF